VSATTAAPAAEPHPARPARCTPTIAIIGAGRAGSALAAALHDAGYPIVAVHSLSPTSAERLAARTGAAVVPTAVAAVMCADLTLLTVPDAAITRVAATVAATGMALRDHAVVHASGAQSREALAALRQQGPAVAVAHPLQALTRDVDAGVAALRGTFFGIDADERLLDTVEDLVRAVGGVPFAVPAGDRAMYHAAAVLAGNAPLALLSRATELLVDAGVDPAVAGPALAVLLEGAARNARALGVRKALTGPVVRDDAATVARHLDALRNDQGVQRLYHRLAKETLRAAGATGREHVAELLARPAPGRSATREAAAGRVPAPSPSRPAGMARSPRLAAR
jgi:predicted short-subunit dehydrogenase-like oxidoreductase (DUF2520 family)